MSYGIDYGSGITNIDLETGIRYGVIPQGAVLQAWAEESEPDYGPPTCPMCGDEVDEDSTPPDESRWERRDYYCPKCDYAFWSDEAFSGEVDSFTLDTDEYKAQSDSYGDIFITKSNYFTYAQFCSPCAPGACYLLNPVDEQGPRCYCFAPDWFDWHAEQGVEPAGEYNGEKTSCPYPVFRVSDGECIYRPEGGGK